MSQTTIFALAAAIYFAQLTPPKAAGWMVWIFVFFAVVSWANGN